MRSTWENLCVPHYALTKVLETQKVLWNIRIWIGFGKLFFQDTWYRWYPKFRKRWKKKKTRATVMLTLLQCGALCKRPKKNSHSLIPSSPPFFFDRIKLVREWLVNKVFVCSSTREREWVSWCGFKIAHEHATTWGTDVSKPLRGIPWLRRRY